jgi:hypothetical protein
LLAGAPTAGAPPAFVTSSPATETWSIEQAQTIIIATSKADFRI